jgi:glyoxylase-like metal-dependent hydrolase (beta-lactamase superfamily II)
VINVILTFISLKSSLLHFPVSLNVELIVYLLELTITKKDEYMELRLKNNDHIIYTLDLNFRGIQGTIAAYLIPHKLGAVLVECGPGSTIPTLVDGLNSKGYSVTDITDVLLTHIHLDHAGAAGWLAKQGANIHVHPVGAPHLRNPEKLLASAERIYGDALDTLWGEFLPVPNDRLIVLQDGDVIEINELAFKVLNTPGHANHHFVYLFEEACFSGDIAGVRMSGINHLRLPTPPPEFNLESWRQSLNVLRKEEFAYIIATHFGVFSDPEWHMAAVEDALDEIERWMEENMQRGLSSEDFNSQYVDWENERAIAAGINQNSMDLYDTSNPSWISAAGLQRYWQKFRQDN